ncbi:MAG: hypothetical protein AAF529_01905 [Pseudomonadota bacterium]
MSAKTVSITAAECERLCDLQATELDQQPLSRSGILPVTDHAPPSLFNEQAIAPVWWVHRDICDDTFYGVALVEEALPVFAAHFPGKPLLPGVVQIDWVVKAAQAAFKIGGELRFAGMSRIKFKAPVAPGRWLRVHMTRGQVDTSNSPGLDVAFKFTDAAQICTQGRLKFHV